MSQKPNRTALPISVVIASKVGSPFIDQCLKSIEGESKKLSAEVIVVVAGSSPHAPPIAEQYPCTRVFHAPDIKRVPAWRCRGVQEATGPPLLSGAWTTRVQ